MCIVYVYVSVRIVVVGFLRLRTTAIMTATYNIIITLNVSFARYDPVVVTRFALVYGFSFSFGKNACNPFVPTRIPEMAVFRLPALLHLLNALASCVLTDGFVVVIAARHNFPHRRGLYAR